MNISDSAEKLNDCDTCDKIKNNNNRFDKEGSDYSSDCEDFTSYSGSLGKDGAQLDSLSLDFDESALGKARGGFGKRAVQQNKTFSSEKIREIERKNALLVDRILYHDRRPNQYKSTVAPVRKASSAEINRRRHQEKISRENQILLKKIQSVKPAVRYT